MLTYLSILLTVNFGLLISEPWFTSLAHQLDNEEEKEERLGAEVN